MVAADQPDEFSRIEPARGLRPDVGVHGHTPFVHAADFAHHIVVLRTAAPFEVVDHLRRIAAQALRFVQQRIVHVGRGDAAAPCAGSQRFVEIELASRPR